MTSKIRNRIPSAMLSAHYQSKIQKLEYMDGDEADERKLTKSTPEGDATPILFDWFGVNLPTDFGGRGKETYPPVTIYNEDDFFNMTDTDATNYLERYLRTHKTVRLNHLLNMPECVIKKLVRKNLALPTQHIILGNLLAQEILLRITNPKADKDNVAGSKAQYRNVPINAETLNNVVFEELFAHKVLPNKLPRYLDELLGISSMRSPTKSSNVFDQFLITLMSTELAVEKYTNDSIGTFVLVDINKGVRLSRKSTGEADKVLNVTPKRIFESLPPATKLLDEAERINTLWNKFQILCDTHDIEFGSIDQVAEDKKFDGMPRKSLYSTNPMYSNALNAAFDDCIYEIVEDKPYDISGRLTVMAAMMKEGLYTFEVTPNYPTSEPWNFVHKLRNINGGNYSSRRSGRGIDIHSFISPYLQQLLWITVAINSADLNIRNNRSSWDAMFSKYLDQSGVDDVREVLKDTLRKMSSMADFMDLTIGATAFYAQGDSVASPSRAEDYFVESIDINKAIDALPHGVKGVVDNNLITVFNVSDLTPLPKF